MERITFTVKEIAKLLGINVTAAYELAKRRDFPAIRVGKRIIVPKDAFYRWLEKAALDKESGSTFQNQK